jgi:ergothioneine biosynthesis protein EgtB
LISDLEPEDTVVQSMPDVSPTKWHLAHVTWFFERFVLESALNDYTRFNDDFHFLFNSYYYTAGQMHARPRRGLLSRPTLSEVLEYRAYVDAAMQHLLQTDAVDESVTNVITLGLHHEQQHQELLLTDIKHVFSCHPVQRAAIASLSTSPSVPVDAYSFTRGERGICQVGKEGNAFAFDNETPRHDALLSEHRIGNRLVTNGEYREFIRDRGYATCELWLSDAWAVVNERAWDRPLYWDETLEAEFTLRSIRTLPSVTSVITRQTLSHAGREQGCRPSSSGRLRRASTRREATCWTQETCTLLLPILRKPAPCCCRSFTILW